MKNRFGRKPIQEFDNNPTEPQVVRTDTIECPNCLKVQQADVVWDERDFWPIFVCLCSGCNYIITESEWNEVTR